MIGKCKLCLQDGVDLQKSHLHPAAIYGSMRGDPDNGNPNPWLITHHGAVQTSRQECAHLLCSECEQRFSRCGESWVLANGLKSDGTFPLAAILSSKRPADSDPRTTTTKLYYASEIEEVDIAKLTYFAASMFWRASVYPWRTDRTVPVKLGPYAEDFRLFLMGARGFPANAALSVLVREGNEIKHFTHEPLSEKISSVFTHRYAMPGFLFLLFVGKEIPETHRNTCFVRGNNNPLYVSAVMEQYFMKTGMQMFARNREKP